MKKNNLIDLDVLYNDRVFGNDMQNLTPILVQMINQTHRLMDIFPLDAEKTFRDIGSCALRIAKDIYTDSMNILKISKSITDTSIDAGDVLGEHDEEIVFMVAFSVLYLMKGKWTGANKGLYPIVYGIMSVRNKQMGMYKNYVVKYIDGNTQSDTCQQPCVTVPKVEQNPISTLASEQHHNSGREPECQEPEETIAPLIEASHQKIRLELACRMLEHLGVNFNDRGNKAQAAQLINYLTGIPLSTCKNYLSNRDYNKHEHSGELYDVNDLLYKLGVSWQII